MTTESPNASAPVTPDAGQAPETPFHDLAAYMATPRVNEIRLSPDGTWLAAAVQTLSADKKTWVTSIWRIDTGGGEPRRLTRSAEGEGTPRFLPDGSLLFVSKRPDPDAGPGNRDKRDDKRDDKRHDKPDDKPALWVLPVGGGEASVLASLPGGVSAVEVAARAATVIVSSMVLPAAGKAAAGKAAAGKAAAGKAAAGKAAAGKAAAGKAAAGKAGTVEDDERLRKRRTDEGVSAILHESAPVRFWDHDLGPAELRLFAVNGDVKPRDLTPDAGRAFFEQSFDVNPDGTQIATGWWQWQRCGAPAYSELVLIDVKTGARRTLASDTEYVYEDPTFSPDGRRVATLKATHHKPEKPRDVTLVVIDVESGAETEVTSGFDGWPTAPWWSPDGAAIYFTSDENGRHPVFKAAADGDVTVRKVTRDGAYTDLEVAADGTIYGLHSAVDEPPTPVRIDPASGEITRLQAPGTPLKLPGHLEEFTTEADDGHPIRSWLVLPDDGQERHPLLLWVHGGPMMSWNSWSWRWNPWLMAAHGYAVLMPDPALSTGYGHDFVQRGYHEWGDRPFRDIMAATDAAVARSDIDQARTAMMGGSYGGYMANWIAGHTDRFGAIVSHASLWMLDQMFGTTDLPMFWRPQFGDPLTNPEMFVRNSPHLHLDKITTPMLIIHGDKDYRVPIGEALRLWWDLNRTGAEAKFLYFPDENHWILGPGNGQVWYETVYAFLAQHVLGEEWRRPELL